MERTMGWANPTILGLVEVARTRKIPTETEKRKGKGNDNGSGGGGEDNPRGNDPEAIIASISNLELDQLDDEDLADFKDRKPCPVGDFIPQFD